ncbi:MAG: PKD domain-containing protein, partial [Pirellula sp.]
MQTQATVRHRLIIRRKTRIGPHRRRLQIEFLESRQLLAAWVSQGPFGATNGQVENIANRPVVGAVHALLAHPTNPDILYAGGTNGGVWKTTNATSTTPSWTTNTDSQSSLSIGEMAFDVSDPTFQTVYAGNGRYSSFGRIGSARDGLLKTTDGGQTWLRIDGSGALTGKNISGISANGNTLVVSVNVADSFTYSNIGIFRSTNGGTNFTQVNNASSTFGLPLGLSYALETDPMNSNVLYSSIAIPATAGLQGVYKSTDGGANWARVSNATMNALFTGSTTNVELAAGRFGEVYATILNSGVLVGIFRSPDSGANWTAMDIPVTNENGTLVGLNPGGPRGNPDDPPEAVAGGQGAIHFSIVADPNNANVVYVGGDRQPRTFGDTGSFPNSIGATDFSGRLFRGNASLAAGSQFVHLTHRNNLGPVGGGTASNSSPHADSRDLVFDAIGNLIESDDGGIYKRTSPTNNTGDWFSVIGNLATTEMHDVTYDTISNIIISGNQDTGTTFQPTTGAQVWESVSTADGGDVAVDNLALAASSQSIRYSSFQNLQAFRRRVYNSAGTLVSETFPARTVTSGPAFTAAFRTPIQVNSVSGSRLILQGSNGVYESLNQGTSMALVGTLGTPSIEQDAIAYGGQLNGIPNPDALWVAGGATVGFRSAPGNVVNTPSQPTTATIRDLTIDPDAYTSAAIVTSSSVFWSTNSGSAWSNITGNLPTGRDIRSIAYVPGIVDAMLVGTNLGIFATSVGQLGQWFLVGTGFPNVLVPEIVHDATDNLLVAGTLGRGAWLINNATAVMAETLGAPTAVSNAGTIPENNSIGDTASILSTTDPTPAETFTYSLVPGIGSADNASFTILANSLKAASVFDFETKQSYSVRVRSTDSAGWWTESALTINVTNVNEPPTSIPGGPYNATEGISVALSGSGTDVDAVTSLSYQWDFNYDGITFDVDSGLQSPSFAFADNGSFTIALRVSDNGTPSLSTIATTSVTVGNANPGLTRISSVVNGNVLSTFTNTGTWSDVLSDTVMLTASPGTIVKNNDGTWSWSYVPQSPVANQNVTIDATEEDGGASSVTFSLNAFVAVTNVQFLYNGSDYVASGGISAALETSKVPLRASNVSQSTGFQNIINYSRGINGVVIDVAGLASNAINASDFVFRRSPLGATGAVTPNTWALAPSPSVIHVTPGTSSAPARIRLEWLDNAIENTWLQIIVNATPATGLLTRDVYYLGHAAGEINGDAPYRVTAAELSAVQSAISNTIVLANDLRDVNKDRRVTAADLSFV